jgi:hypothetical protein
MLLCSAGYLNPGRLFLANAKKLELRLHSLLPKFLPSGRRGLECEGPGADLLQLEVFVPEVTKEHYQLIDLCFMYFKDDAVKALRFVKPEGECSELMDFCGQR